MKKIHLLIICCLLSQLSCKKLTNIPPPIGNLVVNQVFSSDPQATSAAAGMYFNMININRTFSNYGISVLTGMSSDELIPYDQFYEDEYIQFQKNILVSTTGTIQNTFWTNVYTVIYQANAILQGLSQVSGVHDSVKNELIGEAKFIRAFCNFYLVNLFGDIPLVTSINYRNTSNISRSPIASIYGLIIEDLQDAKKRLASDFSVGGGQRIIPNKWAASALLARVYLYISEWENAKNEADSIINNKGLFSLVNDLTQVFLTNSDEAIWQLQQSNTTARWFNVTPEGFTLIPRKINSNVYAPFAYCAQSLLDAFEPGDLRRSVWIDSTKYRNVVYRFPYKYTGGPSSATPNGDYTEYYMVLRLAEQYLIRAEAKAHLADATSLDDLNIIRNRASLPNYTGPTDLNSLLNAIYHERQVELFVEWGHRWLDLKRNSHASDILSINKGFQVDSKMLLYPIPLHELNTDHNLTQNPGY